MSEVTTCYNLVNCAGYYNGVVDGYLFGIILIAVIILIVEIIIMLVDLCKDDEKYD